MPLIFRSFRAQLAMLFMVAVLVTTAFMVEARFASRTIISDADHVFVAKDVIADVLPPPMYLIEARLVLSRAAESSLTPAQASEELKRLEREYRARVAYWRANPPHGLEKHLLGAQATAAEAFWAFVHSQVMPALEAQDTPALRTLLPEAQQLYMAQRQGVDETVKRATAFSDDATALMLADRKRGDNTSMLSGALALAVLAVMFWLIASRLWKQVGAEPALLEQAASEIANGNLASPVKAASAHSIAGRFEAMRLQLVELVRANAQAAENVATASSQIAQGTGDLAGRTERQAATLQETRAAAEQITENAHQALQHAEAAGRTVRDVSAQAVVVQTTVAASAESVRTAVARAAEIDEVAAAIKGVAFQTRMLSLNAAIEAARAGPAGRGFAIVAQEVRQLAGVTDSAAAHIAKLATDSRAAMAQAQAQSNMASSQVEAMAMPMAELETGVAEMAAGSRETLTALRESMAGIAELDNAAQANAALVEETSAAAESTAHQARALQELTARFTTA